MYTFWGPTKQGGSVDEATLGTQKYVNKPPNTSLYVHTSVTVYIHTYIHINIHTYIHIHIQIDTYIYICLYMCIYIYIMDQKAIVFYDFWGPGREARHHPPSAQKNVPVAGRPLATSARLWARRATPLADRSNS